MAEQKFDKAWAAALKMTTKMVNMDQSVVDNLVNTYAGKRKPAKKTTTSTPAVQSNQLAQVLATLANVLGQSQTSPFGAGQSVFGQPGPIIPANPFGQPTTSTFATTGQSNPFGQPTPPNPFQKSPFGQPTQNALPAQSSFFGQQSTTTNQLGITLEDIRNLFDNQSTQLSKKIAENGEKIKDCESVRIKELEDKIEAIESSHAELLEQNKALEERVTQVERDTKRNNIIVSGLDSDSPEESFQVLQSIIDTATNRGIKVNFCRAFHARGGMKIIATCSNAAEKKALMSVKRTLVRKRGGGKVTPIYIDNEMTREDRFIQWRIRAIAKEKRAEGKDVMIVPGKLKIDGVWMRYDSSTDDVRAMKKRDGDVNPWSMQFKEEEDD